MTTEDILQRMRDIYGDFLELSNRVKDAPMRAQHQHFAYCARIAAEDAARHIATIIEDLEATSSRESVPPLLAANLASRTAATESFRKAREILKGV